MQRLFEIVTLDDEKNFIFENIKDHIEDMAMHPKGNYVLLLTFQIFDKERVEFIIENLLGCFHDMCFDQQGICIANKMIMNSRNEEHIKSMIKTLSDNIVSIIQSPYGNYAITQALEVRKSSTNDI
jgi:hypothetical protein